MEEGQVSGQCLQKLFELFSTTTLLGLLHNAGYISWSDIENVLGECLIDNDPIGTWFAELQDDKDKYGNTQWSQLKIEHLFEAFSPEIELGDVEIPEELSNQDRHLSALIHQFDKEEFLRRCELDAELQKIREKIYLIPLVEVLRDEIKDSEARKQEKFDQALVPDLLTEEERKENHLRTNILHQLMGADPDYQDQPGIRHLDVLSVRFRSKNPERPLS